MARKAGGRRGAYCIRLRRHHDNTPIILGLATGLTEPPARFPLGRADQTVVVNEPDRITSSTVLDALEQVLDQGTYVCVRLERRSRIPVEQLALAAHQQLD